MLMGWDDEVWKVFIQGGFGLIGTCFMAYLTFKLNSIGRKQIENSSKIDTASAKADIAAVKAAAAATKAEAAVEKTSIVDAKQDQQNEKLDKIEKQGNGLLEEAKERARKEGRESGEKAALIKLGVEPRRATDKTEHE